MSDDSKGKHEFVGHHAFADFYGCKGDINDEDALKEAISLAIENADMDEVQTEAKTFEPQGVTAISIITQSSVTVHTWPESDGMLVDAITCGPHDPHIIIETLKEIYQPDKVKEWKVERGEGDNTVKKMEQDSDSDRKLLGHEPEAEPDVAPMPQRFQPEKQIVGPGVEVRACPHGHGVFVTQDFAEGMTISSFQSPFVTELEDPSRAWVTLKVGDLWWSEPKAGAEDEWANFLDHSAKPNAQFTNFDFKAGTGDLITLHPIKAGQEILINYGEYAPENMKDFTPILEPVDETPAEPSDLDTETQEVENDIKKMEEELGITPPENGSRSSALKQAYMELADQVGDDMMKLGADQGYSPVELDALVTLQTQAKEAVMRDDLETAAQLLHQLVTFLEQKRQSFSNNNP